MHYLGQKRKVQKKKIWKNRPYGNGNASKKIAVVLNKYLNFRNN